MSEKMYEAIYKVAKTSESDSIVLWMDKVEIKGTLLDCEDRHFKWLNISACHIKAFTFKCCMED